jgi:hypothetical protein
MIANVLSLAALLAFPLSSLARSFPEQARPSYQAIHERPGWEETTSTLSDM